MESVNFLLVFILVLGIPASFAADQITVGDMSLSKSEIISSNMPFSSTVSEADTRRVKVGPAFTNGGSYSGMTLPYLRAYTHPVSYPRWAVRQGREGKFVIAIEVLENGKVGRFHVVKSTGFHMLDEAATKAIRTWEFHPAIKNGKPIRSCIEIPVLFVLNKE